MEKILQLVKDELKHRLNKENIEDLDSIEIETAVEILEAEGLPVYSDFRANLTTPWAIAKYIQLSLEENQLIEKVKVDLKKFIPENIDIAFMKKFSCIVQLSKTFIEGEKQQALTVKYFLDEDDSIHYKLTTTSTWGWDISKDQLKALLKNEYIIPENNMNDWKIKPQHKSWIKRLFHL